MVSEVRTAHHTVWNSDNRAATSFFRPLTGSLRIRHNWRRGSIFRLENSTVFCSDEIFLNLETKHWIPLRILLASVHTWSNAWHASDIQYALWSFSWKRFSTPWFSPPESEVIHSTLHWNSLILCSHMSAVSSPVLFFCRVRGRRTDRGSLLSEKEILCKQVTWWLTCTIHEHVKVNVWVQWSDSVSIIWLYLWNVKHQGHGFVVD